MKNQDYSRYQATLQGEIELLKKKLSTLPQGDLLCARNGRYVKYYISNGSKPTYIPKRNRTLASALAEKKYLSLRLEELLAQRDSLERYQNKSCKIKEKIEALLSDRPFAALLEENLLAPSKEENAWTKAIYEHNPSHPDHLIHRTYAGHLVRSKSEVIIANALFMNKIPYRYECGLRLSDTLLFPDFTILHPDTKEIYYWEHFGMMDQSAYCDSSVRKLRLYAEHGIFPSVNLIVSVETKEHPLDSGRIERIIRENFC